MEPVDQPLTGRLIAALRTIALLAVIGFILQLNSERAYWFYSPEWFTSHIADTLVLAGFYGFAAGLAIWALGRTAYRGWHQVVLAGAVFAWTIEGAVVHVLHEAGPLDVIFPAMFAGWHGVGSFVGLFFLVRKLLVEGRAPALAAAAAVYGLIVGSWAVQSWLPDADVGGNLGHAWVPGVAEPAGYALTMGALVGALAVGHLLLDLVWNPDWRPSRHFTWLIIGGTIASAATVFFTVPYGPIRYAVLVAIPLGALLISGRDSDEPNLFGALGGRIRAWHLTALLPAAVTSSLVYALVWEAGPEDAALEAIRELHVFGQLLIGGGVLAWALFRAFRGRSVQAPRSEDQPASVSGAG
jgi:hypothetical protein